MVKKNRKGLCKENRISTQYIKNSLRAFTFDILDRDEKTFTWILRS